MKNSMFLMIMFMLLLHTFNIHAQDVSTNNYISLGVGRQIFISSNQALSGQLYSMNFVHKFKSGKTISLTSDYFNVSGSEKSNASGSSQIPIMYDQSSYESARIGGHVYLFSTKVNKTWKSHARFGLSMEYYHAYSVDRVGQDRMENGIFGNPYYSYYTLETTSKKGINVGVPMAYVLNFHPSSTYGVSLVVNVTPYINKNLQTSVSLMFDLGRLRNKNLDK